MLTRNVDHGGMLNKIDFHSFCKLMCASADVPLTKEIYSADGYGSFCDDYIDYLALYGLQK